jgi:5-formyltetrahydrofolate cyclo-ligase
MIGCGKRKMAAIARAHGEKSVAACQMPVVTASDGKTPPLAMPESTRRKSQLRTAMRTNLRANPADSPAVCDALDRWLTSHPGLRTIAVFAALPGEVDLAELTARHPEWCWVYPRVAGDALTWHAVADAAVDLTVSTFGIREPSPTLAAIPLDQIDAFLCPGLAFDRHGGRLGRGRGFYDRMLADARPGALKVGVCFACQIVQDTCQEPHDMRMDAVVWA